MLTAKYSNHHMHFARERQKKVVVVSIVFIVPSVSLMTGWSDIHRLTHNRTQQFFVWYFQFECIEVMAEASLVAPAVSRRC